MPNKNKLATRSGKNSAEERQKAIEDEARSRRLKRDYAKRRRVAEQAAAEEAAIEQQQEQVDLTPPESSPAQAPPQLEANPFADLITIHPPQQAPVVPAAVQPTAEMANYDELNEEDDADYYKKKVRVEYDPEDLEFWFLALEDEMTWSGIKAQYTKRQVLVQNLPLDVKAEIKDLLRLNKTQAGDLAYKDAKERLLQLFGRDEGDAYEKATHLMLTGKPSQLAKKLTDLLCKCHPPLQDGCCATNTVSGMWRARLPAQVSAAVAGKSISGANFETTLKLADDVYKSVCAKPVAGIKDPQQGASGGADQLAAYGQQKGQGKAKGQAQQNQGAKKPTTQRKKGTKSADGPPDKCCPIHWQHGKSAYNCSDPFECPWKDFIVPRPKNQKK